MVEAVYSYSMLTNVTKLRDRGRVLKRSELAAPVSGRLVVGDWPTPNLSKRWMRRAELVSVHPTLPYEVIQPIFDVQLMRIDETGMYLMGHELAPSEDGSLFEFVQVWRCTF